MSSFIGILRDGIRKRGFELTVTLVTFVAGYTLNELNRHRAFLTDCRNSFSMLSEELTLDDKYARKNMDCLRETKDQVSCDYKRLHPLPLTALENLLARIGPSGFASFTDYREMLTLAVLMNELNDQAVERGAFHRALITVPDNMRAASFGSKRRFINPLDESYHAECQKLIKQIEAAQILVKKRATRFSRLL